jgi:L-aminopeptidase/D-esterase-like protein
LPEPAGAPALAPGSLADIAGLAVGHAQMAARATGCTVVLCPAGASAGVAVRGPAPGTRETDLLRPEAMVDRVHAVLLTGGSAFGLAAADGVMRWLETRGHGLPVGPARVPIVAAAVLFDLWLGDASIRPDAACGERACEAASPAAALAQGSIGAGAGASVGKPFGLDRAMKGGVGTASLHVGSARVGALVAVNAIGDVIDAEGRPLAGVRTADGHALRGATAALLAGEWPFLAASASHAAHGRATGAADAAEAPGSATTIGVVATDAALSKAQCTQLAQLAMNGLPRAVSPLVASDGDTLFALATGTRPAAPDAPSVSLLGALAAEALALAIRNAVLAATAVPGPPALPAWRDLGDLGVLGDLGGLDDSAPPRRRRPKV